MGKVNRFWSKRAYPGSGNYMVKIQLSAYRSPIIRGCRAQPSNRKCSEKSKKVSINSNPTSDTQTVPIDTKLQEALVARSSPILWLNHCDEINDDYPKLHPLHLFWWLLLHPSHEGAHLENVTEAWDQALHLHLRRYYESVHPTKFDANMTSVPLDS